MKKTLTYILAAVTIGIVLTLIPLLIVSAEKSLHHGLSATRDAEAIVSSLDVEIFAICFIIALFVYLLVKHKVNRDYSHVRPHLFYF